MSLGLTSRGSTDTVRAISGPLTSGDQYAGRPVLVVAALRLLGLDVRVDGVRDRLVCAAGFVLVDHRGPVAVVPHPGHQVTERGAALGRKLVPGVAEVVDVKARHTDRFDRLRPG